MYMQQLIHCKERLKSNDCFDRSWKFLEICKFMAKFSDAKKEQSQNKLNQVEKILKKFEKDVLKNK